MAMKQQQVTLLGIGMGSPGSMTMDAVKCCEEADCIIGAKRMLETLAHFGKPMVSMYRSDEIRDYIRSHPEYRNIVIGLSGDVGFYSGATKLTDLLDQEAVHLVSGISSVVYFASKLRMTWEDMALVSTHGREQNLVAAIRKNKKVFTLASGADSIRGISTLLTDHGYGHLMMHVGVNLSYPEEKVISARADQFSQFQEEGVCVAVLENGDAGQHIVTHGIPDEEFLRDKVPMTKEEVRSVALSKLRLTKDAVVYDVGAGTGSVSVECALQADQGMVYAVERKEDAVRLIEKNQKKFGVTNLKVVSGLAPEALRDLPAPTHAFIGGSAGNMREIIDLLREKNPSVRIVITCIALETVAETMQIIKELNPKDLDICCIQAAKSKTLGAYHMMLGQNPVYIISF